MNKRYRIKYKVLLDGADPLEDKEIKIDNCMSGVHAQVRLEEYLKKKYINFKQLIVFECTEVMKTQFGDLDGDFGDIFNQFGDIFGGMK
jgi:hypothetical protein